jgi:polyisoprenyl-teichoic acid--peptidoglycan teichoic acid transferase
MVARATEQPYPARASASRPHTRQRSRYSVRQRLSFVCALLLLAVASFYAGLGLLTRAYPAVFPGENAPFSAVLTNLPGPAKVTQPDATSVFNKRRNFLIVGIDRRAYESPVGPHLTDAIMVATIDPVTKIANMLSFPRDLYIDQTGPNGEVVRQARINESWGAGINRGGTLDAGARQLAADLKHNFGIEIDHWVMLDFWSVYELIDALGGIEVDVPEELAIYNWLYSDESGEIPPHFVTFAPGRQHMSGYDAVAFGRNRQPTDLERVKRQSLVVETALQQAISQGFLRDPIGTYNAFKDTVYHNVSASLVPGLANLLLDARGKLDSYSVGDPVDGIPTVQDWTTPGGGAVLLWDRENVMYWVNQAFTRSTYSQSNVEIQNGYGFGGDEEVARLGRYLRFAKGFPTVYRGPDVDIRPSSQIVVYSRDRYEMARDIAGWMSLPDSAISIQHTDDPRLPDVLIIIGQDFEVPGG